jgi:hypothetical protein
MVLWVLVALAALLFALTLREFYTDPESPVNPPELTKDGAVPSDWQSKIDAISPIGGDDMAYFRAIRAFYTKVYVPAATKPKDTDVEAFLATPDGNAAGVDIGSLRKLIASAFRVELTTTAAAREAKELVTTGALAGFAGTNLQPGNARDEVYTRVENIYTPADDRPSDRAAEGVYEETQQTTPRRPQDSGTPFAVANVL